MKTNLLLIFVIFSQTLFAQSEKERLSDINNKQVLIQDLVDSNSFRQYYAEYLNEKSSEKGILSFYYNGNELKHVFHIYTKNNISYQDEYYIWDDELIFLLATKTSKQTKDSDPVQMINKYEEYFYFHKEEAIKCLSKNSRLKRKSTGLQKQKLYVTNKVDICDRTEQIFERFTQLLEYQKLHIKKATNLPMSRISKNDIMNSSDYIVGF